MANEPDSRAVSITYPIDLAKLNASIAGKILRPFGRTSWSKSWLGDIPKELRLMVYEEYFRKHIATIHASPNPEYTYESGKTSHDLIFPDCPKSSARRDINEVQRSHKSLFFVCSTIKDEAHKMYLRHTMFRIQSNTCTMKANFLHYEPVTKLVWSSNLVFNEEAITKLATITTAFASKQKLRILAMRCSLSATAKDLPKQGARTFAKLLPHLKKFDAQHIIVVVNMVLFKQEGELPCFITIAPVHKKKDPSIAYAFEGAVEKKESFEEISIITPDMTHAILIRDFVIDAMAEKAECRTCRVVSFDIVTGYMQRVEGQERKIHRETQRIDVDLKRRVK